MQVRNPNIWLYCRLICLLIGLTHQAHSISWRIICYTGGTNIADSMANQRIILNGLHHSSHQINLDWKSGFFEHHGTDTFTATTTDIGPLQNVTLWNDNTRPYPIWVAANITLMNLNDGSIYVTVTRNIYVNKTRMITLVNKIFSPTTQESKSSTDINLSQVTSEPLEAVESSTYSLETESETFLDDTSTESNIPMTAVIYEENTIPTDSTIYNMTATTTISIIIPINSTEATTSSTAAPMCLCPCLKKLSKKEQIEQMKELKKELTIDKKNTSRYIRKKISVTDNRPSARATGYVGIVLLICPFAAILLADLSNLVAYLMAKYQESKV